MEERRMNTRVTLELRKITDNVMKQDTFVGHLLDREVSRLEAIDAGEYPVRNPRIHYDSHLNMVRNIAYNQMDDFVEERRRIFLLANNV